MATFPKHYPESLKQIQELDRLQRESMMTFDVRQNNWILPLSGERTGPATFGAQLREHGMSIRINWEPAQTFNALNASWWVNHFNEMDFKTVQSHARAHGFRSVGVSKIYMASYLAEYFHQQFKP